MNGALKAILVVYGGETLCVYLFLFSHSSISILV